MKITRLLGPLLFACGLGYSTTFTYNATVALNPADLGTSGSSATYTNFFSGNTPFTLQSGDVLTGTITFSNGSMSIQNAANDPFYLEFGFTPAGYAGTAFTSSTQFLGLTGTLGSANPAPGGPSFGNSVVDAGQTGGAARNFSFTGITYTINISSITDINNQPAAVPFSFTVVGAEADNIGVNLSGSTPEPASFLLCGAGCIALSLFRRRRPSR